MNDKKSKTYELISDLASLHTLSDHNGELDYLIDDAKKIKQQTRLNLAINEVVEQFAMEEQISVETAVNALKDAISDAPGVLKNPTT